MNDRKSLAFLLCDAAAFSPDGKVTLYGIFDRILVKSLPALHPQFTVYWKVRVERPAMLELKLAEAGGQAFEKLWAGAVNIDDRSEPVVQGICVLNGIEFKQDGLYRVELWQDSTELIAATDLAVEKITG